MTEQITIATLPLNPNIGSPPITPPTLTITDNPVLNLINYSDKTFIVFGEATKTYKQQMMELGGKFNGRLKERFGEHVNFPGGAAWIFMNKYRSSVYKFVNQVNSGDNKQHEGVPQQGTQINLPTVFAPVKSSTYQFVKWKVYKPTEGMTVTIKAGGASTIGKVVQTESSRNKNIIDTVYIDLGGNTSKLVICNGGWKVWGYMVEHSVYFSSSDANPNSPTNTIQQFNAPEGYDYQDIAGI